MLVTSKGQVTIPAKFRAMFGIRPNSEVEFEVINGQLVVKKVPMDKEKFKQKILENLKNVPRGSMTADEVMALTRGEDD